jgi:ABC-2 type transport system permease protein
MVPGEEVDAWACVVLLAMAGVLLLLAAVAFERRDYGAALWVAGTTRRAHRDARVQRPALRTWWSASLLRTRLGLAVWTLSTAVWVSVMVALEPTVMEAWEAFKDYLSGGPPSAASTPADQYLAFTGDLITPVVAAYVVAHAAGWVADLEQGRVEAVLAGPVSWTRLVQERVVAALAGTAVITLGGIAALVVGAARIDVGLHADGLVRMALGCLLFGGAVVGVCAVVVAVARTGPAIPVITVFLATSYLLALMAPMLGWPDWVGRVSVFTALGHPYLEWSSTVGTLLLVVLFVPGVLLAGVLSERTPKVA